jgi:hydroxymethylbilane synthase
LLKRHHPEITFEIETITTKGDTDRQSSLEKIGGTGVFTRQLELALLEKQIDIAVHSAKDLPSVMTPGLQIGAVPRREKPNDAWLSKTGLSLEDTKPAGVVGTGSPRRRAMLLNYRPDLEVKDIRGNVPTRLQKMEDGQYDCLIMACAGLKRLNLENKIAQILPLDQFVPAPAQGTLMVQIRENDAASQEIANPINDADSRRCLLAERLLLELLGAGCSAAVGGLAQIENQALTIKATVLDKQGKIRLDETGVSEASENDKSMVTDIVKKLIARGADKLIT